MDARGAAIPRRAVACLGAAQLVSWGVAYYLIGGFGEQIGAELGWSRDRVYGGFALALLVMGLASSPVGRLIDRAGGRVALVAGSCANALGCALVATCHGAATWWLAWTVLGLGMRLTLYDAAFAALARVGGASARRAMSQITLLGGLSSTISWPLGHWLSGRIGWRGAILVFAGCALATLPLHLALPAGRAPSPSAGDPAALPAPLARDGAGRRAAAVLYALSAAATSFLNAGMSAHMIPLLAGLGLAGGTAVAVASLRGIGQSSARLAEVLFGRRLEPVGLNLLASALLPLAVGAAFAGGASIAAAMVFAFAYGAGNGLLTITRGTLPLALFGAEGYGARVGRLLAPSFVLSATAPLAYAAVVDRWGHGAALRLSLTLAVMALLAALALRMRFGPYRTE